MQEILMPPNHYKRRTSQLLCACKPVKPSAIPPLPLHPLLLARRKTSQALTVHISRFNRYSMPVTRSRNGLYDAGLDQTNTTRFLFGDEEPSALALGSTPDENFPTLVRRDDQIVSELGTCLFSAPHDFHFALFLPLLLGDCWFGLCI